MILAAADLVTNPEVRETQVPQEIWEVAEEIAASSDTIGLENSTLQTLLKVVLYLDRVCGHRGIDSRARPGT